MRDFWRKIGTPQAMGNFLQLDLLGWLKTNCLAKDFISAYSIPWRYLFPFALWTIWKHQNHVVFENIPSDPRISSSCIHQAREFFFCTGKGQKLRHQRVILVCWRKPPQGWFKLNSDRASLGNSRTAEGGGLIRDCQGNWVKGYMRNIGVATNITVEFWALRDDLILASQLGITQLLVELDAKVVVDLVLSRKSSNSPYSSLLNDCGFLLNRFQQVKVSHAFREANCCADSLAKGGCYLLEDFVVLELPPNDSFYVMLNSDAFGLYSLRLLANTSPFLAS